MNYARGFEDTCEIMPKPHHADVASGSNETLGSHRPRMCATDDRLFPPPIRRSLSWAGALVAYSQSASIGFLPLYRHIDSYADGNYFKDIGYLGDTFLVLWLPLPRGSMGLIGDRYLWLAPVIGVLIAMSGSAGLFIAARARRTTRFSRALVFAGCIFGILAAAITQILQIVAGPNLSFRSFRSFERGEEAYPMHGVLEYLGGVWLPLILYALLALWLVGQLVWEAIGVARGR